MPVPCRKVIAPLVFACALAGAACQTPTGPTASAANQPIALGTLGPAQSQLAAEAVGLSPQDLAARGWDCRPTPIPNRVSCSPPNQMHPLLLPGPPPPADRPPTFTLLVFDNGVFIGTDLLIRSDLYRGQQCNATGAPYRFISRIGYYECLHPVNGG
jgi:hypothetical protein